MPVFLATQEIEIRRMAVPGQHGQKICEIPTQPVVGCGGVILSSYLLGEA
jgi:hypothetical protein